MITTPAPIKKRRKIATSLKFLVYTNALPAPYYKQLHPSQISRYKNQFNIKDHLGHELINLSEEVIDAIKTINQHKTERRIVYGFLRLAATCRKAFTSVRHFHQTLSQHKDQLVEAVQRLQPAVQVEKCARIIGISTSTLRNWITSIRVRCSGSLINLCRKVHPNQLLPAETTIIKQLLTCEQFRYWPLVSLYYYALHHNLVSMALSTWYKYAGLLSVSRLKPKSIKHYGESIRADLPNQYWHADVMQFKTKDGVLNYIYLVVDNFSKMILAWAVDVKLSAQVRANTFREALATALQYHVAVDGVNLVVDGGSENNNNTVDEFIDSVTDTEISKIRALKDVCFSNSQAEAVNRIIKTAYLNHKEILGTAQLVETLSEVIHDYCYLRPHGSIDGLIPFNRYIGKTVDTTIIKQQLAAARAERIHKNKHLTCNKCLF